MVDELRTTLLITLGILVVVIAFRRFKQYIRLKHLPVPQHVRLESIEVAYHPERLRVRLELSMGTEVFAAMLASDHMPLKQWPPVQVPKGTQWLELPLEPGQQGVFFLEVATGTQRTERRFIVRQA